MHKHLVALFKQGSKRGLEVNLSQLWLGAKLVNMVNMNIVPYDILSIVKVLVSMLDYPLHYLHMIISIT
jgi:hypothetical protein